MDDCTHLHPHVERPWTVPVEERARVFISLGYGTFVCPWAQLPVRSSEAILRITQDNQRRPSFLRADRKVPNTRGTSFRARFLPRLPHVAWIGSHGIGCAATLLSEQRDGACHVSRVSKGDDDTLDSLNCVGQFAPCDNVTNEQLRQCSRARARRKEQQVMLSVSDSPAR
jgi:hypothetical protein